jgi:hypothetical protein
MRVLNGATHDRVEVKIGSRSAQYRKKRETGNNRTPPNGTPPPLAAAELGVAE